MPTSVMARSIGVVSVTPAFAKEQGKKLAESLLCKDQDTRSKRNVSSADSRLKTNLRWMCYLWMEILGIL